MSPLSTTLASILSLLLVAVFLAELRYRRQKRRADQAVYDAHHDDLTGLANRRAFYPALRAAVTADRPAVCVVMIDVNDFKPINDTYGHAAGDLVLRAVAHRLARIDRRAVAFRLGGDEFVLLIHAAEATGIDIAYRAWEAFADNPVAIGMNLIPVTISAGIAAHEHGLTADQLTHHADLALYDAKIHGDVQAYPTGSPAAPNTGRPGQRVRDQRSRAQHHQEPLALPAQRRGEPPARYRCHFELGGAAALLDHVIASGQHHRSSRETHAGLRCPGALELHVHGDDVRLVSSGYPHLYTDPGDPRTEVVIAAHRTEGLPPAKPGHLCPPEIATVEHLHPSAALIGAIRSVAAAGGSLVIDVNGPTITGYVLHTHTAS